MADAPPAATDWAEIGALVAAGVSASLQLGKVAPAMLVIAGDLDIGLRGAAGLVSVFSLVALLLGLPAGLAAARAGVRRVLLAALLVLGAAGLAAAAVPGVAPLYALRILEGAAFLGIVVSAPVLVSTRAAPADRALAMTFWSTFMPTGIALGLLFAPLVDALGWRWTWAAMAGLPLLAAILVRRIVPIGAGRPVAGQGALGERVAALRRARMPFVVAAAFACYTVVYFGIAGFLPARLVEGFGVSLGPAGFAGAGAAIANIGGNLLAGRLLRRGHRASRLVVVAGAAMTALSAGTFAISSSLPLTVAAALLASAVGGVVPASLFALAPRTVPEPALVGPALGLMVQFNNLGSFLAPLAVATAARLDWAAASLPLLAAGTGLLVLARPLRRIG